MTGRNPLDSENTRGRKRPGLRARLWLASLGGALAAGIAGGSVIAAMTMAGQAMDPALLGVGLAAAAMLGLLVGLLCGRWVVRGVAARLRRIEAGLAAGHLSDADAEQEWGEVGQVADGVRSLLERERQLRRSRAELDELRAAIGQVRDAVERWIVRERWEPLLPAAGPLAPLAESLDRGFQREMDVMDQNLEAARLIRSDLRRIVDEAQASAEQAEHGYVEATALVTTVREIGRLAAEIQQATAAPEPSDWAPARELAAWREEAARALEELVEVSGQSVEHLGSGLLKVHEIAAQVQLVSNRATLIALNTVVNTSRPARALPGDNVTAELKQLAREVRNATEQVAELSDEVSRSVQAANERMRGVREHVLTRLEQLPAPQPAAAPPDRPTTRWLDRVREMVQDAARKGERLAESQERISSDVQRLTRRLDEEGRDLDGLLVRLTPSAELRTIEPPGEPAAEGPQRFRVVDVPPHAEDAGDASPSGEARP